MSEGDEMNLIAHSKSIEEIGTNPQFKVLPIFNNLNLTMRVRWRIV